MKKSSLMIFEKCANMKYKYENRHFEYKGYYVDTIGRKINRTIHKEPTAKRCIHRTVIVQGIHRPTGKPIGEGKQIAP